MADYDIAQAFKNIENELIDSMMRNFSRHRAEETKEGYNWSQWQAEELKSLEQYRKSNAKKFNKQFSEINGKISQMLRNARANGNAQQEASILKAIKNGFKVPTMGENKSTGEFFKLNDRKLNALIKSTTDDLKRAETAVLRMSNDKYRKAIYNAQVYANTGAGTYEKAVDMACKDMLNAGLNCVEYKNGARHTLSDYADMALKTANKRAYLRGEGEKRAEWGISTVVVNSRQGGCPLCAEYIGKVFIDDVYSNGKKSDGKYPLLSDAISNGLFHPRCKDSTSTYYEGITTLQPVSREEMAEMERREQLEQKQQYANRQTQRFKRRAKYSLDKDNKRVCQARADEWHDRAESLNETVAKLADGGKMHIAEQKYMFSEAKTIEDAQSFAEQFVDSNVFSKTFKGKVDFKGISVENANAINKALSSTYSKVEIDKISGIKVVSPASNLGKKAFKDGADAVFAYSPVEKGIFINKDILKNSKTFSDYIERSEKSWDIVMKNIDKLSGSQRELAEIYKNAGRSLVDGNSIDGMLTHELGHHAQWTLLDTQTNNAVGSRMSQFAPKISGYANASKSEYLAESFSAYMKGESKLLDPEYVKFLKSSFF